MIVSPKKEVLRTVLAAVAVVLLMASTALLAILVLEVRKSAATHSETPSTLQAIKTTVGTLERMSSVPSPEWTYRVEAPADPDFEARMNELGRLGWEIVALRRVEESDIQAILNGGSRMKYDVVLKRQVR